MPQLLVPLMLQIYTSPFVKKTTPNLLYVSQDGKRQKEGSLSIPLCTISLNHPATGVLTSFSSLHRFSMRLNAPLNIAADPMCSATPSVAARPRFAFFPPFYFKASSCHLFFFPTNMAAHIRANFHSSTYSGTT